MESINQISIESKERKGGNNLPQPSQSFIEVFVREYNKGNIITDVLVEYESDQIIDDDITPKYRVDLQTGLNKQLLKINSKDNTITIKKVKDSWNREELISKLKFFIEDTRNDKPWVDADDEWIKENL